MSCRGNDGMWNVLKWNQKLVQSHSVCHCSIYSLVVAVLARFLSLSMSERDRFQRSGTWPSCLSKISRSNMRFTVELKQSALSTPVFCRRRDSQLFHWGNFDVRASLQKHKISPSRPNVGCVSLRDRWWLFCDYFVLFTFYMQHSRSALKLDRNYLKSTPWGKKTYNETFPVEYSSCPKNLECRRGVSRGFSARN